MISRASFVTDVQVLPDQITLPNGVPHRVLHPIEKFYYDLRWDTLGLPSALGRRVQEIPMSQAFESLLEMRASAHRANQYRCLGIRSSEK